jgi:hypothetical protein
MRKSILKMWFQCLFGLTRRVGAIERLIQTFDANRTLNEENHLKMGFPICGPTPHGFTWGLVLLKDLLKPPIPFGIFMPKSK